ncbi:hypothetical protein [Acinetobacter tandoii]|uniref:Uncharacterized protein n=1 Tax=Acinetobacter tandoii DSM 14970 = CIP 107469 TaxID=1120927 RepID=R9B762_9GAMM|nr:hypothetical protein [Acinetobacter tandoii]EOR08226.1 hypothetical protein I593_01581 [Acinetobacter tandoii DSM 14970 = CIP 107469]
MLVKINSDLFVLASDVVQVKKITKPNSSDYGKWVALVKHEFGTSAHEIPESEVNILVSDINRFLEK